MAEKQVKQRRFPAVLAVLILVVGAFFLGYFLRGGDRGPTSSGRSAVQTGPAHGEAKETQIFWTCSMHPQIRLPEAGQCPICFMDLIPLRRDAASIEGETISLRQIRLTPEARRLAEVQVQPVSRRSVKIESRMVGKVDYDETRVGHITAWTGGRIDKLYVDFTGSPVSKGQPVAEIYSPELLTAQAELIQAMKSLAETEKGGLQRVRDTAMRTERAAREKLRLLGLSEEQIENMERRGAPSDHVTLRAPMSGIVIEKDVVEGMYVSTGTRIYTIADLSRVWVILEAYESDLPWVKLGQPVEFQAESYPGENFRGRVVYIDPVVNQQTRTIRVRLEVPNPGGRLKPGMFVRAVRRVGGEQGKDTLVIPASAPLLTGKRAIVYVQVPNGEGSYEGREVVLGLRAGEHYIVKSGLEEGELVVTRGNFKIDSAVQLLAKPSMMNPSGAPAGESHDLHRDDGAAREALPGLEIPFSFSTALGPLTTSFRELGKAVEDGNLEVSRRAFARFLDTLRGVDPATLTGQAALYWKEFAMVLRNDAFLGSESDSPEEASRLFKTLAGHFRTLEVHFPALGAPVASGKNGVASDPFKRQLGNALEGYGDLHRALARDDLSSAVKAAKVLRERIRAVDMGLLQGDAHSVWMKALESIRSGLDAMARAGDIEGLRAGFDPLSVGMSRAVADLGVEIQGPVFELTCSMAFDNRGAVWLQRDQDILNPYFGEAMLRCGEVKRQLKGW